MGDSPLTTVGTVVAGLVLAVATAFGIASASGDEPAQRDEPTVLYGER